VLDADLAGAFDRIAHEHLLAQLGTFPARGMVEQWLKAGVVEQGRLSRTEEGTPQGGVVSPVLLNVALHGMEQAAGVRYYTTSRAAGWVTAGSPVLIRYADDLVALCHSRHEAEQVKARLASWLAPRGLAFNEDKTRVVSLDEGFDFLGFNVRRQSGKLLIKPTKAAQRRIRKRLRTEMRSLRGANARAVIKRLNPIIRGWAAYYRGVVSSEAFSALDAYEWKLAYKWARFAHPNKPGSWVIARYFGQFNKSRHDQWVFGDRDSGAYLHKFAWTRIVRHPMVKGTVSPDDPALADYWAKRRSKAPPLSIDTASLRQFDAQHGRCHLCGDWLLPVDDRPQSPREWEPWLLAARKTIITVATRADGTSDEPEPRLMHAHCHGRLHQPRHGTGTSARPRAPRACLSRMR
jgi:RNA-directed DNA polymerase